MVQALAGRGGMGAIYRALDLQHNEVVALKLIERAGEGTSLRFAREAWVLSQLSHPAIVRHVAHGETAQGQLYLAMEWLEGEDLAQRLARGPLTIEESIVIGLRMSQILSLIHAKGVVHRDVKPSNIFLPERRLEAAKLLDFGIAHLEDPLFAVTKTGVLLGTPGYMAPEQARGNKALQASADLFSLGCVLFQCITGKAAFTGEHAMAVLAKILFDEPLAPCQLRSGVPVALDSLIRALLAKNPQERPRSGEEVYQALLAIQSQEGAPVATYHKGALTQGERRLFCLLALRRVQEAPRELSDLSTMDSVEESQRVAALREACEPYGGRLESLADGSSVIALFSKQGESATDQAFRSAWLALSLREKFSDDAIVLAMGRSEEALLPVGDVIDRATKLFLERASRPRPSEQKGPAIFIDELSATLIGGRFELGEDHAGHLLIGEKKVVGSAKTLLGKATSCVGRDRELANLEAIFEECASEPLARGVLVTAAAGVGKSRLCYEFMQRIEKRAEIVSLWIGRGEPMLSSSAFSLLLQVLQNTAGLLEGEPPEVGRKKLYSRLSRTLQGNDLDRVFEFLGERLGLLGGIEGSLALQTSRTDPRLMSDHTQRAWEDWLRAECEAQPVVLILEDLHWSDPATVKTIDIVLRNLKDHPLMVLALARPEVYNTFPKLWAERRCEEIKLGELTRKASEKLVRNVLDPNVSLEVIERLVKRAAGNAFYLEELCRVVSEGHSDAFPETVLAMASARIEGLPKEARRILRAASIFGESFWQGGLRALLGESLEDQPLEAWLGSLSSQEIISEKSSSKFPREKEYSFRHAFLREASYSMLTEADRALGHRLAGEWLIQAGEHAAAILAEHLAQGGGKKQAQVWYCRAAEQVLESSYAVEEALRLYGCACDQLAPDDPERFPIHMSRSRLLSLLGRNAERELEVKAMLDLSAQSNDPIRHSAALVEQARFEASRYQREAATKTIEEALLAAKAANQLETEVDALQFSAELCVDIGELPRGLAITKESLQLLGDEPSRARQRAKALNTQGVLLRRSGDIEGAIRSYRQALLLAQEAKERALEGQILNNLGVTADSAGYYEESLDYFMQGIALDQKIGNRSSIGIKLGNVGQTHLTLGDLNSAVKYLQQAQEVHEATEEWSGLADALTYLAYVFLLLSRFPEARANAEEALKAALKGGRKYYIAYAQAILGECLLASSKPQDWRRALTLGQETASLAKTSTIPSAEARGLIVTAKANAFLGDLDAAYQAAIQAVEIVERYPKLHEKVEIYLQHALLLHKTQESEAKKSLIAALQTIEENASRISSPERREMFLAAYPNRDVKALARRLLV